ncbi:MAG: retroviral-like aspartic protease family protein [Bacteroidales bacterium]|nr:retroviral-like aspartic protease family protein [Bacteroidales bacterium]
MLDLDLALNSEQIMLPVRLENAIAGKATYTKRALWDTGAEMSGVSDELATWLQLERRDVGMYMQSASGIVPVEVAMCKMQLLSGECFEQEVMILPTNDTPVIVGFDIIKQGLFSLEPMSDYLHFHFGIK